MVTESACTANRKSGRDPRFAANVAFSSQAGEATRAPNLLKGQMKGAPGGWTRGSLVLSVLSRSIEVLNRGGSPTIGISRYIGPHQP